MKSIIWLLTFLVLCIPSVYSQQAETGLKQIGESTDDQDRDYRISITFTGGFSYFTENTKDEEEFLTSQKLDAGEAKDYYNRLASGYHLGAILKYNFGNYLSIGLQYRFFNTNAALYGSFDPEDGIHLYYGKLSENIYINYAGLGFYTDNIFKTRTIRIWAGISAGMAFYRNEGFHIWSPYLLTGSNLAFGPSVGIDIPVVKSVSIVAEGSWLISKVKKVKINSGTDSQSIDLDKDNYEDISNLNISAGLSFKL